jgi:hypothetical protein
MNWPRYIFALRALINYTDNTISFQANTLHGYIQSSNLSRNTMSGSDINYSSVIEKKSGMDLLNQGLKPILIHLILLMAILNRSQEDHLAQCQ